MTELKTKVNEASVEAFMASINDHQKQADSREIVALMAEITGEPAKMWGEGIVGFGSYRYKYATGREGDWFITGFAPRKQNLTLYIMAGFMTYDDLLGRLGKHSTGKSCLYIKRLADVNRDVLRELIQQSVDHMRAEAKCKTD